MKQSRQSVSNPGQKLRYNYRASENMEQNMNSNTITNNNKWRQSSKPGLGSRASRPEQAYQNYHDKMKALCRVKYINQLARLQYEQKLTELHTRHSNKTKETVIKKIKAKNQIAEFIDEEDEYDDDLEELVEFNYGIQNNKGFYYERQSKQKQYAFCPLCDTIHMQSPEEHNNVCDYKRLAKSSNYYLQSLDRMKKELHRMTSKEAQQLLTIAEKIERSENVSKELEDLQELVKDDRILLKMAEKLKQIMKCTQY